MMRGGQGMKNGASGVRLFPPWSRGLKVLAILLGICYLLEILWIHWLPAPADPALVANHSLLRQLGLVPASLFEGMFWQPLTYALLHDPMDPLHLLLNILGLWIFGSELEQRWGLRRFCWFLLLCVLGGAVGIVLVGLFAADHWTQVTIGASAMNFGCMAAFGLLFRDRVLWPLPIRAITFVWLLFGLTVLYFLVGSSESFGGHLGGMIVGLIWVWRQGRPRRASGKRKSQELPAVPWNPATRHDDSTWNRHARHPAAFTTFLFIFKWINQNAYPLVLLTAAGLFGACRSASVGPFAGDATVRVTLEAAAGDPLSDPGRDGVILATRLRELGVNNELLEARDRWLVLRLIRVRRVEELMQLVLPRRDLAFYQVAVEQHLLARAATEPLPPGLRLVSDWSGSSRIVGSSCEALAPLRQLPLPPGQTLLCECSAGYRDQLAVEECFLLQARLPPFLTRQAVRDALVILDPQTKRPLVSVSFDDAGQAVFAEITGRSVGQRIAMVLDGRVVAAPVVRETNTSGRARLELGALQRDPERLAHEAHAVAVALDQAQPLDGSWSVRTIQEEP